MQEETEMTVGRLIELLSDYPKDFKIKVDLWSEGINVDLADTVDTNTQNKTVYLVEVS